MTDPIQHLSILCRDKLKESFQRANYTISNRTWSTRSSYKVALRMQRTTIFRCLLSMLPLVGYLVESEIWLMTILFYKDHVMISSRRTPSDDPQPKHLLEVSYSDPKLIDILLSEMRLVW